MNNVELARLYRRYNKKYFGNKLPAIRVVFASILRPYGQLGVTHYEERKPVYIHIDKLLRKWNCTAKLTLLHEMNHVSLPFRVEHGPVFERGMRRLARLKAFTGLW